MLLDNDDLSAFKAKVHDDDLGLKSKAADKRLPDTLKTIINSTTLAPLNSNV
jgi:hypothetical protein